MANRRMFSLKVVDTDTFLEMSASAQNLYFHLGMRADDDGFVSSPKKIMVMCNASEDDMKVLLAKGFLIKMVTNGVSVITHWHMNNLIRPDRYQETEYKEEKKRLNLQDGKYNQEFGMTSGIPLVATGKVRLGKDRLGEDTKTSEETSQINELIDLFKVVNPSFSKLFANKTQRVSAERLLKIHGLQKLSELIQMLPKMNGDKYAPIITTPVQLEDKFGQLIAYGQRKQSNQPIIL